MHERKTILDYSPETYERVRQAMLHVATILGEWMEQVTLIGGIVPSLLVPASDLPESVEAHPGTARPRPGVTAFSAYRGSVRLHFQVAA